jgi:AraC family transcriptional regulator
MGGARSSQTAPARPPLGAKPSTRSDLRRAVQRAVEVLEARLDDPPHTAELARAAGLSAAHFHRAFRAVIGETVAQHALRLRLERAASYLKFSVWQVQEIALVSGFATQASFTRAFRRLYGMSPLSFRRTASVTPFLRARLRSRRTSQAPAVDVPVPTVRLEEWPELEVVCVRTYASMDRLQEAWGEMLGWALRALPSFEHTRFFGLWYDDWRDGPNPTYRYECGLIPGEPPRVPPPPHFVVRRIPAGLVAVTEADGRRYDLDGAWRAFGYGWLPRSRLQLRLAFAMDEYSSARALCSPLRTPGAPPGGRTVRLCLPVARPSRA